MEDGQDPVVRRRPGQRIRQRRQQPSQSFDRADVTQTRPVTTQEAVLHEVIAEEQEAAEERLREEQAEADHANGKRSWLTSWIYAKVH